MRRRPDALVQVTGVGRAAGGVERPALAFSVAAALVTAASGVVGRRLRNGTSSQACKGGKAGKGWLGAPEPDCARTQGWYPRRCCRWARSHCVWRAVPPRAASIGCDLSVPLFSSFSSFSSSSSSPLFKERESAQHAQVHRQLEVPAAAQRGAHAVQAHTQPMITMHAARRPSFVLNLIARTWHSFDAGAISESER